MSDLSDVLGELSFDTPTTLSDLAAIERSCAWCFETYRVQLVRLFLARNRKRAILLFRAPDAESVRLACRHAQLPFERVWPCRQVRVVLLQEPDMRGHVRVNFPNVGLVDKLDDEHRDPACIKPL
jgi:hypothetical protein